MNSEKKKQIVKLLTAILDEYSKNGNDVSDTHYIDLACNIAIRYKSPIAHNEVDMICDYIGVNHTTSNNSHYDEWKRLSLYNKIIWLKSEIDKLDNELSYQPKTITDILSFARPIPELINLVLKVYSHRYDKEKSDNNSSSYYILTDMLVDGLINYPEYKTIQDYLYKYMPDWFTIYESDDCFKEDIITWLKSHILATIQPETDLKDNTKQKEV